MIDETEYAEEPLMRKPACVNEIQDFSFCHMHGETIVIPSGEDQMPFNISSHLSMPPFINEPDVDWDKREVDQFEGQPDSPLFGSGKRHYKDSTDEEDMTPSKNYTSSMTSQRPDDDEMNPRQVYFDGDKQSTRKLPGKKNTASDE